MAEVTSGSFNTSAYATSNGTKRYLTLIWERTSYSIENNTSTISYTLKGAGTYTGWVNVRNIKLVIDGTTVYTAAGPIQVYNGTVLKSGTVTISHNTNGTKSFSASAECGIYYSAINGKGSGSWDLKTIPRASTITATNGDIGSTSTITITKASSTFTHTLKWKCLDLSGTIATKTSEASVNFTIPTSLYAKIPKSPSVKVTVTCETFNGSTSLGTNSCEFTATANKELCKPTVTFDKLVDDNNQAKTLTGNEAHLIKDMSIAKFVNFKAKGENSATVKSVTIKNGSKTLTLPTSGFEGADISFAPVQSGTFEITVTDSRDYSATVTHTTTMHDYFKPTMTVKVQRDGQTGEKVKAEYTGKFCHQGIFHTMELCYVYDKTWRTIAQIDSNGTITTERGSFTCNGNDFSGSLTLDEDLDYRQEHQIRFGVWDRVASYGFEYTLIRGVPMFDYGENDFNFNVPIYYKGQPITEDFIVEQGTENVSDSTTEKNVTWTYRKWNSGIAECWATREITGIKVDKSWGGLYYAGDIESISYPFAFISKPTETATMSSNNMACLTNAETTNTTTQSGKYYPIRPTAATTTTYTVWIHYQVMGRWK